MTKTFKEFWKNTLAQDLRSQDKFSQKEDQYNYTHRPKKEKETKKEITSKSLPKVCDTCGDDMPNVPDYETTCFYCTELENNRRYRLHNNIPDN